MATRTWRNSGREWNDPANWGGTVPGPQDDVVLLGSAYPVVDTNVGSVRSVTLEIAPGRYPEVPSLAIDIGGTLKVTDKITNPAFIVVDGQLTANQFENTDLAQLTIGSDPDVSNDNPATKTSRVDVTTLINNGQIEIDGGDSGQATLDITGPMPLSKTVINSSGLYTLRGDALLEVADEVKSLSTSIQLDGPKARVALAADLSTNSALRNLSLMQQNSVLEISDGASVAIIGDLTNHGFLTTGTSQYGNDVAASLSIGGTLTNDLNFHIDGPRDQVTLNRFVNTSQAAFGRVDNSGAAQLTVTGTTVNSGSLIFDPFFTMTTGSFTQTSAGSLFLDFDAATGHTATIKSTGDVDLAGSLTLETFLSAGQTANLMTFRPGHLAGVFDQLLIGDMYHVPAADGSGTTYSGDPSLKAGIVFNDATGTIQFKVVAAPSTTIDTFRGSSGSWTSAANWSAGAPTFYSDTVIDNATVTLTQDVAVNSVALKAGAHLVTASGTDLGVGATMAVDTGASATVGGYLAVASAVTDNGSIAVSSGATADVRGNAQGTGTFTIGAGASLIFRALETNTVSFTGTGATLEIDRPSDFSGTLANMVVGDAIDLAGTTVASASDNGGR